MYLAGIDLGTTGCKSMVFDSGGAIRGSAYIEYGLIFADGKVEQDANLWWDYTKMALKEALAEAALKTAEVAALAVSSQGISSVAVDAAGRPLANAISWYDQRAQPEADEIAAAFGADWLFETTGRRPSSVFFPQVLHIKRHEPDLYNRAAYFLMPQDYLVYRLTGKAVTDYTLASGTLCFDTTQCRWIEELFRRFDVDMKKFPALKRFGDIAGTLLPEAAAELGLPEKTLVAVGMQDQKAAALGAGIEEGIVTLSLGTAGAVSVLSDKSAHDPSGRVFCHAFDGNRRILENHVGAAGAAFKWLRDTLFPGKSYAELDALAEAAGPGAGGLSFNPGLDLEMGAWNGLSLKTTAGDMCRAVLEGVAFAVRECLEAQREASAGARGAVELRAFGGGAKSGLWLQILADCLSLRVSVPRTQEAANVGAALCAGTAAGCVKKNPEGRRQFVGETAALYSPNPELKERYNTGYRNYRARKEVSHAGRT